MNRQRLDLEALRDALLAVAGRIDLAMGGKSVDITTAPFTTRRTVYAFIERQNLPGLFRTFDFAGPDTHSPQRPNTTVPQQGLYLLNSPFVMEQAEHLATRQEVTALTDPAERIRQLHRLVYGRPPTDEELRLGLEFIAQADPAEVVSPPPAWQYGYGAFDEANGRVAHFAPLPHWTGDTWQGGPQRPDPKIGWVLLTSRGGHPGDDAQHAAIRRWTAPAEGTVALRGRVKHPRSEGDGVRCRVVSSRTGLLGEWTAHNGQTPTNLPRIEVRAGETLDFVTDCRTGPTHDGFEWPVTLTLDPPPPGKAAWRSSEDFTGPRPNPLTVWAQYAQVLLLSNEFAFVD